MLDFEWALVSIGTWLQQERFLSARCPLFPPKRIEFLFHCSGNSRRTFESALASKIQIAPLLSLWIEQTFNSKFNIMEKNAIKYHFH